MGRYATAYLSVGFPMLIFLLFVFEIIPRGSFWQNLSDRVKIYGYSDHRKEL